MNVSRDGEDGVEEDGEEEWVGEDPFAEDRDLRRAVNVRERRSSVDGWEGDEREEEEEGNREE